MVPHNATKLNPTITFAGACALEVHEVWCAIVHAKMEQHTRLPCAMPRSRVSKTLDKAGIAKFEYSSAWRVASGRK